MKPLTQHLHEEHTLIMVGLRLLEGFRLKLMNDESIAVDDCRMVVFAMQTLVESCHHRKEEELLFPAIMNSPRMNEGGPRCTHFMTVRMMDNTASRLIETLPKSEVEKYRSEQLEVPQHHPLSIPLEEHMAGHLALLRVRMDLDSYALDSRNRSSLMMSIWEYTHLLRIHIEKEDTCLFVLADQILSEAEQRDLLEKALRIERNIGVDRIQSLQAVLVRLGQNADKTVA